MSNKSNNKKEYVAPKMEILELSQEAPLLACSDNDNDYWNGCHEGWQGGWGE